LIYNTQAIDIDGISESGEDLVSWLQYCFFYQWTMLYMHGPH